MAIQRTRSEQKAMLQAFIGIKQSLKDFDAQPTPLAKMGLLQQALDANKLDILKNTSLNKTKTEIDAFINEVQTVETYNSTVERFNKASQDLDECLQKTQAILPALIKSKTFQTGAETYTISKDDAREAEQDSDTCKSELESTKSELTVQGICHEAKGGLCIELKTQQPIDPAGEPTKTNIRDAFMEIVPAKCNGQFNQALNYVTEKVANQADPQTVGELAEYLNFDCSTLPQ